MAEALAGRNFVTWQKLSDSERILNFLASYTTLGKLAKDGANLGNLATNVLETLNKIKHLDKLAYLAYTAQTVNNASITLTGNDLTNGSGRKIQGVNRFLATLQTTKLGLGYIGGKYPA